MPPAPLLLLGLALSVPSSDGGASLLECARRAHAGGDAETVRRCLRGWATLRRQRKLPEGLKREAADATSWAAKRGMLRIYGSRLDGRVRIGVDDPAGIVDRLDVFVDGSGGRYRLLRAEQESAGRNEYVIPPAAHDQPIVVEAVLIDLVPEPVVLRRTTLVPHVDPVPDAPDPERAKARVGWKDEPAPAPVEESPILSWWWIAAGVVAAGFVGAAVWQETR